MKIDAQQQPDMRAIWGSTNFLLLETYFYEWTGDLWIRVPRDFICDGASIPRVLWSVVGVRLGGRIRAAALVHDWLYYNCGDLEDFTYTRAWADLLFRRMMSEAGMERRRIEMCYWAVRIFGDGAWRSHLRERRKGNRS